VLSFNGYTREFPKGGNRILAVDLCDGRVAWKSKDGLANSTVLLVGDYLVSAFGFTSERRYVYALDARSGAVLQKLGVVENVCPSKSWAPNWDGGRCDAPGQIVGAAHRPRIDGGLLVVDTNTGSSAFELK
jgi:outer membrane protein assembly factor BamB